MSQGDLGEEVALAGVAAEVSGSGMGSAEEGKTAEQSAAVDSAVGDSSAGDSSVGDSSGGDSAVEDSAGDESLEGEELALAPMKAVLRGEVDGLSADQRTALESLALGNSVIDVAKAIGVSRGTVYYWLKKDARFRAAYNEWHEAMKESCKLRLKSMLNKAASAVEKSLENGDGRLGMQLLKAMGMAAPEEERDTDAEELGVLRREERANRKKRMAKLATEEWLRGG